MKKAFVIVDYQNDFINGSLGFEKASLIKENILELLKNLDFKDTHLLITLDWRRIAGHLPLSEAFCLGDLPA